jgi:hypothetical protein
LKNNLRRDRVFQMIGKNRDRNDKALSLKDSGRNSRMLGQAGQVMIESLLLMVLSVSLLGMLTKYFADEKTFGKLTNAIWAGVAQMTEYGNWPGASAPVHPNSSIRARLRDPQ